MRAVIFVLLIPFSWLYKFITSFRNLLFDLGILKTLKPDIFSIGVGNITTGGTGKTPMVDFLVNKLPGQSKAVLSRGYGRKTKGFLKVDASQNPDTVGDEMYMLYKKNKGSFYVCENRVEGYRQIKKENQSHGLLILDDVMQHRYIRPQIMILLSDYNRPFYKDFILPAGLLRESRMGAKRADLVVVSKCKFSMSLEEKQAIMADLKPYLAPNTSVFFALYEGSEPRNIANQIIEKRKKIVVLSGIANNHSFLSQTESHFNVFKSFFFKDHYSYNVEDIQNIIEQAHNLPIVTTKKDWIKIEPLLDEVEKYKFFMVDIQVIIDKEEEFLKLINDKINKGKSI
jgi:tetraacyldisaccharide 4'-kinase